jgi:aspartate carbamoyltransferase catalytic subunit
MSSTHEKLRSLAQQWSHDHLLGLEGLTATDITLLLDTAELMIQAVEEAKEASESRKVPLLVGKTVANLFFENSTRTRNSFSLAAKRLGADTVEFAASGSSVAKGETFIDTRRRSKHWESMRVVTRHATPELRTYWQSIWIARF